MQKQIKIQKFYLVRSIFEDTQIDKDYVKKLGKKKLQAVNLSSFNACVNCDELFNKGFLIDDDFYCKKCAIDNFKNYIKLRKECEK